jgi:hypothetical protein
LRTKHNDLLLETLRLLDIFLPRINFGKVKTSEALSATAAPGQSADATDFPYLKRDLVRLLGILCHNSKAIQDRIRICGGIRVVLNLCVIDDRNPCEFLFRLRGFACCCGGGLTPQTPHSHAPLCPPHAFHFFWSGLIMKKNPDLRENALFALRNLLHNNPENQAVVDTFRGDEHVEPYCSGS